MSEVSALAERAGRALAAGGHVVACAESCTGGGLSAAITAVAGSSRWFDHGVVAYSNAAKQDLLGVAEHTLERCGAVSEAVAVEMARGALRSGAAGFGVGLSGVAGPGGGTVAKPVGTVCMAWVARSGEARSRTFHFIGDREAVRRQAVISALEGLLGIVEARD